MNKLIELWRALWRPSASLSLGALALGGFVFGILFWGGFNWAVELTNTEAFCIGCHEMRNNVYAEYKKRSISTTAPGCARSAPTATFPRRGAPK